jgi:ATP-dependent RNA helicase DeaD
LTSFDTLGLSAPLLQAIQELGFETPTDIQAQAIPMLLEGGRDFIGLAQTGTGKTAAFGLPLLDHLDASQRHVQALVLAPTRELGQQIAEQLGKFAKHKKGLRTVAVYGGANIVTQMRELKSPRHVVIATPGRLIDLIKRKGRAFGPNQPLDLGRSRRDAQHGLQRRTRHHPRVHPDSKNTWLFSATMPKEIRRWSGNT